MAIGERGAQKRAMNAKITIVLGSVPPVLAILSREFSCLSSGSSVQQQGRTEREAIRRNASRVDERFVIASAPKLDFSRCSFQPTTTRSSVLSYGFITESPSAIFENFQNDFTS